MRTVNGMQTEFHAILPNGEEIELLADEVFASLNNGKKPLRTKLSRSIRAILGVNNDL